jgi:ATP-dependent Clp protease ATP-binding subunit ClpC
LFCTFTERARRVVELARQEACAHNNDYIGTEHILLGLIHDGNDAVGESLQALGIRLDAIREQVEDIIGLGHQSLLGHHLPFTARAKKALERSLHEAQLCGHDHVDAEHILCGLTGENDATAAQTLTKLGVELPRLRQQLSTSWDHPSAQ